MRLNDVENTSKAIFAQASYNFTDKLSATFGLRHTKDDKRYSPTHVTQGLNPVALLIDDEALSSLTPHQDSASIIVGVTVSSRTSPIQPDLSRVDLPVEPLTRKMARPFDPEEAETLEVGVSLITIEFVLTRRSLAPITLICR